MIPCALVGSGRVTLRHAESIAALPETTLVVADSRARHFVAKYAPRPAESGRRSRSRYPDGLVGAQSVRIERLKELGLFLVSSAMPKQTELAGYAERPVDLLDCPRSLLRTPLESIIVRDSIFPDDSAGGDEVSGRFIERPTRGRVPGSKVRAAGWSREQ